MRIQNQIFLTILLIFSCVSGLATWLYYIHFSQSLNHAKSQQARQINRYVEREIKNILTHHNAIIANFNKDGDVTSAYDQVNWVSFMGQKFIRKTITGLFDQYPYLDQIIFYKDNKEFLSAITPQKTEYSKAWISQTIPLDVAEGKLTLKTNILPALQNHLTANKINKATTLYFENSTGAWLIKSDHIERLPQPLTLDSDTPVQIREVRYLASSPLGTENWTIQSLFSQNTTENALRELLIRATIAYIFSALLFFFIARYLSSLMIRPLQRLERAALALMDGRYNLIEIDTEDETLPAIQAFNSMSKRIQGFTQELQNQVAARTKELEIANAELALMNETDILTGARSRQFLTNHVPNLIKLAHRSKTSVGIAMLDIDHFKKINDTYGHVKGDQCLVAFSETIHQYFRRDNDWIIRYGGEEFCLICFALDHSNFKKKLEEFRKSVNSIHIHASNGENFRFSVSIGYSFYEKAPEQWSNLIIARADEQLYKAKGEGRDQTQGTIISQ